MRKGFRGTVLAALSFALLGATVVSAAATAPRATSARQSVSAARVQSTPQRATAATVKAVRAPTAVPKPQPPVYPPPGGVTLVESGDFLPRPGGHTYTFTGFDLSLERKLYWGPTGATAVGQGWNGATLTGAEIMTYDATQPDLAAGKAYWHGSTTWAFNASTWTTRFTLTVSTTAGTAIPLIDAASVRIPGAGAVVQVTGDFKANMLMEAKLGAGVMAPSSPQFDNTPMKPSTLGGTLQSNFDAGFYAVQPRVEVLPALANGAYGGYTTATYVQNTGAETANAFIAYFDQAGASVGIGDDLSIPAKANATVRQDGPNALPAHSAGSGVVFSDQPLAAFVNEFAPNNASDATSYTAVPYPAGIASTLFAPAIASAAYGGYTTGIGLVNLGRTVATITITYRDGDGVTQLAQTLTNIQPGAYQGVYSGNSGQATDARLPAGFTGTATISSDHGQLLAAVVNESGPGAQFSSYDAVASPSALLFAPVALNNAFGGFTTGMGIQNTTATAGTVTINYYDGAGTLSHTSSLAIKANGYLGVYQGTDIPTAGAYTASISTATAGVTLAAIVNEVGPPSGTGQQSTSYNTVAAGAGTVNLALVENLGSDLWNTGEGVMNTGSALTTVTITYYDAATGSPVGTPQAATLAPNAFWGVYQPNAGLPAGARATAVVTTGTGGQVAVICNETNATSFMSYNGQ